MSFVYPTLLLAYSFTKALSHRIEMMCALTMVDYGSWFEEDDPREFLTHIKPDIHVNGAEYGERV